MKLRDVALAQDPLEAPRPTMLRIATFHHALEL